MFKLVKQLTHISAQFEWITFWNIRQIAMKHYLFVWLFSNWNKIIQTWYNDHFPWQLNTHMHICWHEIHTHMRTRTHECIHSHTHTLKHTSRRPDINSDKVNLYHFVDQRMHQEKSCCLWGCSWCWVVARGLAGLVGQYGQFCHYNRRRLAHSVPFLGGSKYFLHLRVTSWLTCDWNNWNQVLHKEILM